MKKRLKQTIFLIIFLLTATFLPALEALADDTLLTDGQYHSYYELYPERQSDPLGAAQNFAIFARDVTLSAVTNGNIATETFHSSNQALDSSGGQDGSHDDIYIKNIAPAGGALPTNIGNKTTTRLTLGGNSSIHYDPLAGSRPLINNSYVDTLNNSQVFVEENSNPFIDFDSEFAKLEALDQQISSMSDSADITVSGNSYFSDNNNRVIDVSAIDKSSVLIHLDASVLEMSTPLNIMGLESAVNGGKTVYVIVDGNGSSNVSSNAQINLYYKTSDGSGTKMDAEGEMESLYSGSQPDSGDYSHSTILWTFTNQGSPVTNLSLTSTWWGTILAPNARLTSSANIYGSIIVDDFTGSNVTHRWDFQPSEINLTPATTVALQVKKFDAGNKQEITDNSVLAPMQYQLNQYADDGSSTPTILKQDSSWSDTNLATGSYGILEASAPKDYVNDSTEIPFTVADDGSVSYTISYTYTGVNTDGASENRVWTVAATLYPDGTADAAYTDKAEGQAGDGSAVSTDTGIQQTAIKLPVSAKIRDSLTLSGTDLTFNKYDQPVKSAPVLPLPSTGGVGTILFYLLGGLLTITAVLYGFKRFRYSE